MSRTPYYYLGTLTGQNGSLITELDKILVNGMGSLSGLAITRSGTTATVNKTAHGYVLGQTVRISGASQSEYNGDKVIASIVDANNFTFEVSGSPATPATGSIASIIPGAGWSIAFTATNKRVYLSADGLHYLRILDDGSLTGAAREAMARAGTGATDVDTLVNPFPTVATVADNACVWRKSSTADATARAYLAVADGNFLILQITSASNVDDFAISGKLDATRAGDAFCYWHVQRAAANSGTLAVAIAGASGQTGIFATPGASCSWMAKNYAGTTVPDLAVIEREMPSFIGLTGSASIVDYPHPDTGDLDFRQMYVTTYSRNTVGAATSGTLYRRGKIPFLFEPVLGATVSSLAHGDTFTSSAFPGCRFLLLVDAAAAMTATNRRRYVLQIAGAWG